jgi:hypothetical protein
MSAYINNLEPDWRDIPVAVEVKKKKPLSRWNVHRFEVGLSLSTLCFYSSELRVIQMHGLGN